MQNNTTDIIQDLIAKENEHIFKIEKIIEEEIEENKRINHYESEGFVGLKENDNFWLKVANDFQNFAGSWKFLLGLMIFWLAFIMIGQYTGFDPRPYKKMDFILSIYMTVQGVLIMIAQNKAKEVDEKRDEKEYYISLKSESEVRNINKKIDIMILDQIRYLMEVQKIQIEYLQKLDNQINKKTTT